VFRDHHGPFQGLLGYRPALHAARPWSPTHIRAPTPRLERRRWPEPHALPGTKGWMASGHRPRIPYCTLWRSCSGWHRL